MQPDAAETDLPHQGHNETGVGRRRAAAYVVFIVVQERQDIAHPGFSHDGGSKSEGDIVDTESAESGMLVEY